MAPHLQKYKVGVNVWANYHTVSGTTKTQQHLIFPTAT